jgi:putative two-component system response regulator
MVLTSNKSIKVLLVDDDEDDYVMTRDLIAEIPDQGFDLSWEDTYEGGVKAIGRREHDVYLLDYRLGEHNGLELLRDVIGRGHRAPMILLTGQGDRDVDLQAMRAGAADYLVKGRIDAAILERSIRYALERKQAERELRLSREETIVRLARAAEVRDEDTGSHIQRVSQYCGFLARRAGLGPARCEEIRLASLLHDVGKIAIPDYVLLKPGRFTPQEYKVMQQHADIGHRILAGSKGELLKTADLIAWTHHEKYDGSGYPRGLAGEAIPLEGRITAIADVFDALTNPRVYKPAHPLEEALFIMREGRGEHFDPTLLDLFLDSIDQILELKELYSGHDDRLPYPAMDLFVSAQAKDLDFIDA